MFQNKGFTKILIVITCLAFFVVSAQEIKNKELYIPKKVWMLPENNDYKDPKSDYNFDHMITSANFAIFWHKDYGKDPMLNTEVTERFDPNKMLSECERIYNVYVNQLKLVQSGNSLTDKYKILIFVFKGEEKAAFGGGDEDKVGIFWTPAVRVNKEPYGVLAHELGHSFQYLSHADTGKGPDGTIMEMSAQYMLWQVYSGWMTFENYHLVDYLKGTYYGFLHPYNMYHSPYVIEYWSEKHGKDFFGKLMRNSNEGEDPVMTYKRLNSINQEQFNDEMFDASRRFITWDLPRIDSVAKRYANKHFTKVNKLKDKWYIVDSINCPQNYGYNGIQLNIPKLGTKLELNFKGIAGENGFSKVKIEKAGWRYGFVAQQKNGKRIYSQIFKKNNGKVSFKVPKDTEHLWLVVLGAPTEHWSRPNRWGDNPDKTPDEQWPYEFQLSGTTLADLK
ncbi:hypothetical protein C8C83_4347 [Flavobacterium sp. 90]|uniref:DUF6055 domain-containing protein n=1 Tax=unclassified Flavobacterium TaxID=196869 RepID=UPI000EAC9588|nr:MULTISPECIES: DUF6055 domain-containing protein [unclassified Flavobacterium]RKR05018.1 hypothetical protein C8C82_4685 [Flavobacterium sp. 81]TCK56334.1 hypothetical protein C8C83_4347 [Flavobacterium sp. 90]